MKIKVKNVFFLLIFSLFSCDTTEISYFITYRQHIHEDYISLGKQICLFKETYNKSFKTIFLKLSETKVDFEKTYMEIPPKKIKLLGEHDIIANKLLILDKKIDKFFARVDMVTDAIKIKQLRMREKQLNKVHKKELMKVHGQIHKNIKTIRKNIEKIEDIRHLMLIALLKKKVGKSKEAISFLWNEINILFDELTNNIQKAILMTSKQSVDAKSLILPCKKADLKK